MFVFGAPQILFLVLLGLMAWRIAVLRHRSFESLLTTGASGVAKVWVDGKHVVVRSGTVLPPYCVRTNIALEPDEMRQEKLGWSPPFTNTVLDRFFLFQLISQLVQQHCLLTFGLSAAVERRHRDLRNLKLGLAVVSACAFGILLLMDSMAMYMALIVFCCAVVLLLVQSGSPLSVTSRRDEEFWVWGCSDDFIERLKLGE